MPAVVQGQPSAGVLPQPAMVTQLPDMHALPAAQAVPSATFVDVAVQTDAPVAHEVMPTLHGELGGMQLVPWTHEQDPAAHPRFTPQLVPSGAFAPVSTHICIPVAQDCIPA